MSQIRLYKLSQIFTTYQIIERKMLYHSRKNKKKKENYFEQIIKTCQPTKYHNFYTGRALRTELGV